MDRESNIRSKSDEISAGEQKSELVSVYMPTRNRVHRLRNAVDSVLNQTYRNIELIVVNDGSTDDTAGYLERRAADDRRLIIVTNARPQGAPASRNSAILKARGRFVTGLDDDDSFDHVRVGAFVEYWNLLAVRKVTPACVFSQDILVDDNGDAFGVSKKKGSVSADELIAGNYIGNQIFAPREHFIGAGLFDERLPAWQDLEFFIRVLNRFGDARLLDMATYVHSASLRSDRISAQEERIRAAFEIVAEKHAKDSPADQKALFLQMFDDHYDIAPRVSDWFRFVQWGGWSRGTLRLLRRSLGIRQHMPSSRQSVQTVSKERLSADYGNV